MRKSQCGDVMRSDKLTKHKHQLLRGGIAQGIAQARKRVVAASSEHWLMSTVAGTAVGFEGTEDLGPGRVPKRMASGSRRPN